ncbi:hypothetical protein ACOBR2_19340 [Telmatobacter bradus]|uniref:hypothetical protein n=1 Tax=Telmatobacter bradus TaxID=474953 RepID=UPI003B427C84
MSTQKFFSGKKKGVRLPDAPFSVQVEGETREGLRKLDFASRKVARLFCSSPAGAKSAFFVLKA